MSAVPLMAAAKREAAASRPVNTSILRRSHHGADLAPRNAIAKSVHPVLRGPGEALDPATRGFMQARFNHDFSGVRVHADAHAARSVDEMQARAYTVGRDIVFGRNAFAPHSNEGRRLIAHELTHVVQNEAQPSGGSLKEVSAPNDASEREASAISQRIADTGNARVAAQPAAVVQRDGLATGLGIGGAIAAVAGGLTIAWAAGAFDSNTFTDKELQDYLGFLEKNRKIEGKTVSDNKARAVVQRWKSGAAGFTVLIVPIRILLINEMADGHLSDDDQDGILDLLTESIPAERAHILPAINIDTLKGRFGGDRKKKLAALLESQDMESISLSDEWTVPETKKINARHGDGGVLKRVLAAGFKIFRFETAFDKWKYDDGTEKENELTGLEGNTDSRVSPKRIRLRKSLTNEVAASTLFHESDHALSPPNTTKDEYLEGEAHARVQEEGFRYRHGMQSDESSYRTAEGKPNVEAIRKDVKGSDHYNPTKRKRIGRRYVAEAVTEGWDK